MGFEIISTDRGLAVMDSEKVKRFRLLKSIKAKNSHKNAYDFVVKEGEILSEALSNFNLSIDQPMISSLDQKTDSNDTDFISSEQYLGDQDRSDNSHFQTENPDFIGSESTKSLRNRLALALNIITEVVPHNFLRPDGAIKTVEDLRLSSTKSKISQLTLNNEIKFRELAPHIKAMALDRFSQSGDPIRNPQSSGAVQETMMNLYSVRAIIGFQTDPGGFIDVYRPITRPLTQQLLKQAAERNRPLLAKAHDFEVPELGILKDNFLATIYNNLMYIRG